MKAIPGLHHVTAIATDPQRNLEFYVSVLGLRLVKQTVNFDDPTTYHLYYGDAVGTPGTILTFFPWPGAPRGSRGTGQATAVAFAVPPGSLDWWMDRLGGRQVEVGPREHRFDESVLRLEDPDGLAIELVEQGDVARRPWWREGPIAERHAIRGFHSVTITVEGYERTAALLADTMGLARLEEEHGRFRYGTRSDAPGAIVDVLCSPDASPGRIAAGTIHHVAFRSVSDGDQAEWRERLSAAGQNVTPVLDRQYFHSIYYREPGGVLFEIATDPPGFTLDESAETLGSALRLPPWLERRRRYIQDRLPALHPPAISQVR